MTVFKDMSFKRMLYVQYNGQSNIKKVKNKEK